MRFRHDCALLAVLLLLAFAAPAIFGQGETTASITGVVLDPTGAAMPNSKVTVTNTDTGAAQVQMTDAGGQYNFPALVIGNYRMDVEAPGFRNKISCCMSMTGSASTRRCRSAPPRRR